MRASAPWGSGHERESHHGKVAIASESVGQLEVVHHSERCALCVRGALIIVLLENRPRPALLAIRYANQFE